MDTGGEGTGSCGSYCAVYDFELFPYALGDVLTWNVQTATRCEELGRERVDRFICLDERRPPFNQKSFIKTDNCGLFFDELFGAFGTHPRPGRLFLYRHREDMLRTLRAACEGDEANLRSLADYEHALESGQDNPLRMKYFAENIYSHERVNAFAARHGRMPMLRPSVGCERDVATLISKRLRGEKIVAIHMRLRRLDAGYGVKQDEMRDSDFVEWCEFLQEAAARYPEVQFVVVGRLQEKPLEQLRMSNVTSLRRFGLGLGHELTLMLRSDLFIGTSSGFAGMVFFSAVPYFITRMTRGACQAYSIEYGAQRLPFGTRRQVLVYEPETSELLMQLLERGLDEASVQHAARRADDSSPRPGSTTAAIRSSCTR